MHLKLFHYKTFSPGDDRKSDQIIKHYIFLPVFVSKYSYGIIRFTTHYTFTSHYIAKFEFRNKENAWKLMHDLNIFAV
jgi:hypothetical protein